jgi:hypothetical protein
LPELLAGCRVGWPIPRTPRAVCYRPIIGGMTVSPSDSGRVASRTEAIESLGITAVVRAGTSGLARQTVQTPSHH